MHRALADRLIDMCVRDSELIAEHWYKALIGNPRTHSYNSIPKATCLRHAVSFFKNLGNMYLAESAYKAVEEYLDITGFAEDQFARGIPLEEAIYALVLMRREIWLQSERQSLFNIPEDMYELVLGINRILLLFDYATYILISKYREISKKTAKLI